MLEDLQDVRHLSIKEYGLDDINAVLQRDLQVHNEKMNDMMTAFGEITTDRARVYGASNEQEMVQVDQTGQAPTQKSHNDAEVDFPLHQYQTSVGWTGNYFRLNTPADLAEQMLNAQKSHRKRVVKSMQEAIFPSSNYSVRDYLNDNVQLNVKRFVNADGDPIPDGPNGEKFNGSSHTHYLAQSGIDATGATQLVNTVVEHGHGEGVRVAINAAQEDAWRGLSSFYGYLDPRLSSNQSTNEATNRTLDNTRLDNRAIGIYKSAEVWVKPWVPSGYAVCWSQGETRRPVVFRVPNTGERGLYLAGEVELMPLHAETLQTMFGCGVWNRTNGAVLYSGGATYTDPTF